MEMSLHFARTLYRLAILRFTLLPILCRAAHLHTPSVVPRVLRCLCANIHALISLATTHLVLPLDVLRQYPFTRRLRLLTPFSFLQVPVLQKMKGGLTRPTIPRHHP